jgi:enoyl-CoA hydratase/carnithine racemase
MHEVRWETDRTSSTQVVELCAVARDPGVLLVRFEQPATGPPAWPELEPWTRTRAVTVADIAADLRGAALEVALCCDLVYVRSGCVLGLPGVREAVSPGLLWAAGRAGPRALARYLLSEGDLGAVEAARLGLVQAVLEAGARLPLPEPASVAAMTAVRDLGRTRSGGSAGLALELATFRLLFATGAPNEGARAFLEDRTPHGDGWLRCES